ncbi:c-type cytochrome [Oceanithermus sp.]
MNQNIERIEVFLDESKEPLQVLTSPPFKVKLDTQTIPDGPHSLRVVTVFKGGKKEESVVEFEVDNLPSPFIEGIDEGQQLRGTVEFEVLPGDYEAPKSKGRLTTTMAVLSSIIVLGLVWAFFAFSATSKAVVEANAVAPKEEAKAATGDAARGEKLFTEQCASCHGAKAEGGFGPALAGNALLDNPEQFDKVTTEGRGNMPPFSNLSAQDLADIRAYLSSLGGASGGEQAAAAAPAGGSEDVALGKKVYSEQCAGCHGANGEGGYGPALAGNPLLDNPEEFNKVTHEGRGNMPPYPQISDKELAAIRAFLKTK